MIRPMKKQAAILAFPIPDPREAPEARRLELALEQIRVDAREQSRHYRDDTVVPEGGE
jgi:hypothetical protein